MIISGCRRDGLRLQKSNFESEGRVVAAGRKVETLSDTPTCSRSEAAAINPSTVLSERGKGSAR